MLKAISLFSGAGGDTLGMISAGIDVIGYIENNESAIKTHEANFTECKLIGKDITQIPDDVFKNYTGIVDVIFGGFPCQSFSHGGKKNANDKRGFLYQEFVRCADIIKPKIVIGENVKGLLSRKMNDGTLFIDKIISDFSNIGYDMKMSLFNMKHYGIPQDRQRLIIYGIKRGVDLDFNLQNIDKANPVFLKDVLQPSLERALQITSDVGEYYSQIKRLFPSDVITIDSRSPYWGTVKPTLKPPTNLIKCVNNGEISFKKLSRSTYSCIVDKNDVSRTILSTYSRMPRLFVPIKSDNSYYLRPYTIRELGLIQGSPESFIFKGSYIEQVIQIGNAIPPLFVQKLFKYIIDIINKDIIEI